jgi:hypothetical protein
MPYTGHRETFMQVGSHTKLSQQSSPSAQVEPPQDESAEGNEPGDEPPFRSDAVVPPAPVRASAGPHALAISRHTMGAERTTTRNMRAAPLLRSARGVLGGATFRHVFWSGSD